jgi:hypothetical protein
MAPGAPKSSLSPFLHVHYEVLDLGEPLDPAVFLR